MLLLHVLHILHLVFIFYIVQAIANMCFMVEELIIKWIKIPIDITANSAPTYNESRQKRTEIIRKILSLQGETFHHLLLSLQW